jgi:hypothetical protein
MADELCGTSERCWLLLPLVAIDFRQTPATFSALLWPRVQRHFRLLLDHVAE